ncbi:membrane protein [Corynebacterium phage EmiRose]|uniref:Membrane protein n=1 Tax=Corynebacterium phage EmiRose TaxID=2565372 RepID=A0A649VQD9_9CAUD|nr:membrane protein [Corynebacterium phage EmiRose]QGJ94152.1 membrane protein [Corynebacterium phage EmiRose]
MSEHARKTAWREPWFIRRAIYALVGLVLLVAAGSGLITPEQSDTWLAHSDSVIQAIASLGLFGAAVKANPGSDLNKSEVDKARAELAAAKRTASPLDDLVAEAKLAAATLREASRNAPVKSNTPDVIEDNNVTAPKYGDLPVYRQTSTLEG